MSCLVPTGRREKAKTANGYIPAMAKIFLNHPIADYDTWRPIYDADTPRREAAGMTNVVVLRNADDPNSIWLVGDGDPEKFNTMMQDPGLADAMQKAGVTGPPQVFFAT
ncbi:MAG: hypothetical protein ABI949_08355 [Ilumatobacteraceae bacterium]